MEKTSAPVRWWDWASIALLFVLLQTVAARLVATNWTPLLNLTQTATYLAFIVGTALGYSRFPQRLTQWLSAIYMFFMLPLQWSWASDQQASLEEQLFSVAGRLYYSTSDFLARRPVEDALFFVIVMTVAFWFISAWAPPELSECGSSLRYRTAYYSKLRPRQTRTNMVHCLLCVYRLTSFRQIAFPSKSKIVARETYFPLAR
jgi:hypothetical protein